MVPTLGLLGFVSVVGIGVMLALLPIPNKTNYCPPQGISGVLQDKQKVTGSKGSTNYYVEVVFERHGTTSVCKTSTTYQMFNYVNIGDTVKTLN